MSAGTDATPPAVNFRLMTHWGTFVYFDEKNDGFFHGKSGEVPDNLIANILGDDLVLNYSVKDADPPNRTETFKCFRQKADIAFARDNLFACAETDGSITISRDAADDWEHFLPVPFAIAAPPSRDALSDQYNHLRAFKSKRPINLFWWRGESQINLGDEISPRIVSAVSGRKIIHSLPNEADLMAVGSILTFATELERQTPTHVWGSGLIEFQHIAPAQFIYSAVRGPLTRACVSRSSDIPVGDPGLLTSCVWQASKKKRYSWGIVPHHKHIGDHLFRNLHEHTPRSVLINLANPDIHHTIKTISECDFIITSSLHGLIIADSYGIPNVWIKTAKIHGGANFKFYDYFLSIGRSGYNQVQVAEGTNLHALEAGLPSMDYLRHLSGIQDALVSSFPAIG